MRIFLSGLAIVFAIAGTSPGYSAPSASTVQAAAPAPKALSDGLDAIALKYSIDKAWFYLARDDGKTVGYARGDAVGVGRPLPIGSLSKSVTAIGIAVLIQDRRLTMQTRLGDVLPGYLREKGHTLDPSLASIDIAHLLAHRAGLRTNATSDPLGGLSTAEAFTKMTPDAHFSEYLYATDSNHSDGTSAYRYSNLSYLLLGMVIEAVSKQPYETFMQDRVLRPTGVVGRISPTLQRVATFSGWEMSEPEFLRLWAVFDADHPTLLSRATLEETLLSRALPPTSPERDVYYTTGTYVRQSADRRSYVVTHNGISDFLRGQPNVYAYAEKYVPGYSWIYVFQTPASLRVHNMRPIETEVRQLVDAMEGQK